MKALTPEQARERAKALQIASIPDGAIEAFNDLIARKIMANPSARVFEIPLGEAAEHVARKLNIRRDEVFKNNYLDVEPIFEKAGWRVKFIKMPYCEVERESFLMFQLPPQGE